MNHVITILAFSVVIPLGVGLTLYKRLPRAIHPIVHLLSAYFIAEVYMFVLRLYHIPNMHVSYALTVFEVYFFSVFYAGICSNVRAKSIIDSFKWSGLLLVAIDYLLFGNEMNTLSLSIEFVMLISFGAYFYYETLIDESDDAHSVMNFTLLFYMLSSFPYFFAWEWLRVSDMYWLGLLASIHAYVNAACYLFLTHLIWRYSLRLSAR